jgi:hypothetical protein
MKNFSSHAPFQALRPLGWSLFITLTAMVLMAGEAQAFSGPSSQVKDAARHVPNLEQAAAATPCTASPWALTVPEAVLAPRDESALPVRTRRPHAVDHLV